VKPDAVTWRSLGRKAPKKLGCGQSDSSDICVSRATGATLRASEPLKARSTVKANARGGCAGSATTVPPSLAWMPLRLSPGKPTLGAKATSGAPSILSTAASLRPDTPDRPSTKAASRQRTLTTSAATSAIAGAAKRPDSVRRAL
jgi:hypothetical protein